MDLATGLLIVTSTDFAERGTPPIIMRRTYRTSAQQVRAFGLGTNHTYGVFLYSEKEYEEADLIMPDGLRVHFVRVSPGMSWFDAVFRSTSVARDFVGATLAWNGAGWDLRLQDGTVLVFGERAPLQAIHAPNGAVTTIMRQGGQPGGNIVAIRSADGRCFGLDYDGSSRVTKVTDDLGSTVGYAYDASGDLSKVTDPSGAVTGYRYDAAGHLTAITDGRGLLTLAATYDTNGRVQELSGAGGTYRYRYVIDSSGIITETEVTDPAGEVRRVRP